MKRLICGLMVLMMLWASAAAEGIFRVAVDENDLSICPELDEAWRNILLMGSDNRGKNLTDGRADSLMVCSIHRETGEVRLLSLARDMYIPIPNARFSDKINTAFRYGGPYLQIKAVNETLKLNIAEYVVINFYGFCDVIDRLGGVEIELSRSEAIYINHAMAEVRRYGDAEPKRLTNGAGKYLLCGEQALVYTRIRKLDNDFMRTQRQRNVMAAALKKLKTLPLGEQLQVISCGLNSVDCNIPTSELLCLFSLVMQGNLQDVQQMGLPSKGNFHYKNIDGKACTIFDQEAAQADAHRFIYGE